MYQLVYKVMEPFQRVVVETVAPWRRKVVTEVVVGVIVDFSSCFSKFSDPHGDLLAND